METIRTYIDQMFKDLPKTKEVVEMKLNILDHMEEKYHELIAEGKSESEASRHVISEFGDMDEILKELGIDEKEVHDNLNYVSNEDVDRVLAWKATFSIAIAIGVVLCINAAGITQLVEFFFRGRIVNILMGISMFILVGIAVVIFILFGINDSKYNHYLDQPVIEARKKLELEQKASQWSTVFAVLIAVGVLLCILATGLYPVFEYTFGGSLANFVFMLIVSIGVFLFIFAGINKEKYDEFIQPKNTGYKQADGDHPINGIIMMSATIIYLTIGFLFHAWHPGWIVFVIGGLLCGIVELVLGNKRGERK